MEFITISSLNLMGNFFGKSVQNSFLRIVSLGMKIRPYLSFLGNLAFLKCQAMPKARLPIF